MAVWGEFERHLGKRLAALGRTPEGQGKGEIRPLDEVRGVREEVVFQDARERRSRRFEAGGEEVAKAVGDLGRDDGRNHEGVSGPELFGSPPSINPEAFMPVSSTKSRKPESGVLGLPQPRRDVPFSAKQPPDIDMVVVLDVKHQIRESSQRPGPQARQVQLMGVAR